MSTHEHHSITVTDYNPNVSFIDDKAIWQTIEDASNPSREQVLAILDKARQCEGLSISETAILLQNQDKALDEALFTVAREIKNTIYGNRIVMFAPLYVSNHCANSCSYCGFNADNHELKRKTLKQDEIRQEVTILEEMGHKRILAVYGEHPRNNVQAIVESIQTMYSVKQGKGGEIRRINVNCAPMSVEDFKQLKTAAIGTYQCFQETYHQDTYSQVHLKGKKPTFYTASTPCTGRWKQESTMSVSARSLACMTIDLSCSPCSHMFSNSKKTVALAHIPSPFRGLNLPMVRLSVKNRPMRSMMTALSAL